MNICFNQSKSTAKSRLLGSDAKSAELKSRGARMGVADVWCLSPLVFQDNSLYWIADTSTSKMSLVAG